MKWLLLSAIISIIGVTSFVYAGDDMKKQYQQWSMGIEAYSYVNPSDRNDCINLSSDAVSNTGDLLSTLVVWDISTDYTHKSGSLKLKAYTPNYLLKLDSLFAKQTNKKFGTNFYSNYLCHVSSELDTLYWRLYSETRDSDEGYLVIRYKNIVRFYSGIRGYNTTVTGGDVSHCGASLSKNKKSILWSCMVGYNMETLSGHNKVGSSPVTG